MKRSLILGGIIAVIIAIVFGGMIAVNIYDLSNREIINADLAKLPDGIYGGSYSYVGITCKVHVEVKDHKIVGIDVDEARQSEYLDKAKSVVAEVLRTQSLKVDTVTSATFTSKAILRAVEDALAAKKNKTVG